MFQNYGGTLKDNEKVLKVLPKTNSVEILTETYGQYSCRSIVLCLGAWSGKFLKTHLSLALPLQVSGNRFAGSKLLGSIIDRRGLESF